MKKYIPFIIVGILLVIVIVSLVFIGPAKNEKSNLKIKKSSIPNTVEVGDIFTIETETNLHSDNIKFSSSNNDIAQVNSNGLVTILSKGEVTIVVSTVYEKDNPLTDSVKIKVK